MKLDFFQSQIKRPCKPASVASKKRHDKPNFFLYKCYIKHTATTTAVFVLAFVYWLIKPYRDIIILNFYAAKVKTYHCIIFSTHKVIIIF